MGKGFAEPLRLSPTGNPGSQLNLHHRRNCRRRHRQCPCPGLR